MSVVGLDIGGANLKAADTEGRAAVRAFPLWREPDGLAAALRELLQEFERPRLFGVTMTGELADCFRTKAEGVERILDAVEGVAGGVLVQVWQTGAEFLSPVEAREVPLLVAAANWHALATWVGRLVPGGTALLVDVGSTTTDVVPLRDGVPVPEGLTDVERLLSRELVYTGVKRTPVCAVAESVPFRGGTCPLAAELFATMQDVHLVLGDLADDADDRDTANGRPATAAKARDRLARMLCCDRTECSEAELVEVAGFLAERQRARIGEALASVSARQGAVEHLLLSGSGTFLTERIVADDPVLGACSRTRLEDCFGERPSAAACAFAVAHLGAERVHL